MNTKRYIGLLLILISLAIMPVAGFAYTSNICVGDVCDVSEVGRFMQGISRACGNQGDCELKDIMLVFVNVSYFVLGLIGSIVLLMYIIGGFYWLTAAGLPGRVSKGKEYLKISTIGLLIVLFSYLGVEFLLRTLTEGNVQIAGEQCVGKADGIGCGDNMQCKDEVCVQK